MITFVVFIFVFLFTNFELLATDENESPQKVCLAFRTADGSFFTNFTDLERKRAQEALGESTLTAVEGLLKAIENFRAYQVIILSPQGTVMKLKDTVPDSYLSAVVANSQESICSLVQLFFPKNSSRAAIAQKSHPAVNSIRFCRRPLPTENTPYEEAKSANFLKPNHLSLYVIPELLNRNDFLRHMNDFAYLQYIFAGMRHLLDNLEERGFKHFTLLDLTTYQFVADEAEVKDTDVETDSTNIASKSMMNALTIELGGMRAFREKFLAILRQFYSHVRPLTDDASSNIILADPLLGHQNPLIADFESCFFGEESLSAEQKILSVDQCCEILTEIHRWHYFYRCCYELISTINSCSKKFLWKQNKFECSALTRSTPTPKKIFELIVKAVESNDESEPTTKKKPQIKKDTRSKEDIHKAQQKIEDLLKDELKAEADKKAVKAKNREIRQEAAQRKILEAQQEQAKIAKKKKNEEKEEERKEEESRKLKLTQQQKQQTTEAAPRNSLKPAKRQKTITAKGEEVSVDPQEFHVDSCEAPQELNSTLANPWDTSRSIPTAPLPINQEEGDDLEMLQSSNAETTQPPQSAILKSYRHDPYRKAFPQRNY